jgi:hypothetical protein
LDQRRAPFSGGREAAVDETLFERQTTANAQVVEERDANRFPSSIRAPSLEPTMGRRSRRILFWQMLPLRTRAQHPKHAIQESSCAVLRRTTLAVAAAFAFRDQRFDQTPLLVGEVHEHDSQHTRVRMEMASETWSNSDHLQATRL